MRKPLQISGLLSALLLASNVEAAGLGRLSVQSALGQPLRAEIELVAVQRDELGSISARLASAEAFRQAHMERAEALNGLRFEVEQRANGQPVIRITSAAPVTDPFLDLLIELNWSTGRLIREYTLLLDPPADTKPKAEAPAAAPATSTQPERPQTAATPRAAESAAKPAEPTRYGPVKPGETLHAIASKTKPADVTLDQMMLGIYQQNNTAFQGNNMNRLKRGAVLKLPDRDTAMRVDPARASREVRMQAEAWNAYRSRLADAAAARAAAAAPEAAAGRVTPTPERREAPPAAPEDVLRLSKGEPGAAKAMEKIQSLEEELAAKGRALLEAQERVAQLERTVKDMQRLLELKAAEAPVAAPPAEPAAPTPAPEASPKAPQPVATAAPQPAAKPAAVPAPLPSPEPEPGPSWLSTFIGNPLYIGGIVAAVLLSFLLWMMMVGTRRRKGLTNFEDSIMTGGEFKNEAVFTAGTGVAGTPTGGSALMTDFSRLGLGAIDAHEVDPIAEAEVYMAYGRDTQAEEILKEALAKDPNRHEISLKLLEIYAARKDTVAFETQASELYASVGGQPTEVWMKAAEMGRSIDPDNPLYRVTPGVTGPAVVAAGTAAAAAMAAANAPANASAEPALGEDLTDLGLLSDASDKPTEITPEVKALMDYEATPPKTEEPAPVEAFDLGGPGEPPAEQRQPPEDLGMLEMELPGHDMSVEPEQLAVVEGPEATEYDLSLDVTEVEEQVPAPAAPEVTVAQSDTDMAGLEMSIEAPAPEPAPMAEVSYAVPELDLSGIDLDLGEPQVQAEAPSPGGMPETMAFESGAKVEEVAAETPTEIDPEVWEETNTKLDLARAYLEMGDHEGAREILQEVLSDGDSRQRNEARKLLDEVA